MYRSLIKKGRKKKLLKNVRNPPALRRERGSDAIGTFRREKRLRPI